MTDSAARARILDRIRDRVGGAPRESTIAGRLLDPVRHLIPARTAFLSPGGLVDLFASLAEASHASVEHAPAERVPARVSAYLQSHNLPAGIVMAPDPELDAYPWGEERLLSIRRDRAREGDAVGVTVAFAGVAETGTLLLLSSANQPATLHLMPDTHVVIMPAIRVVAAYEDAWDLVRQQGLLPRTATFVTGPSRTGDIEQRMQLGAHGPRRLHIILVAAEPRHDQ